MTTDSQLPDSNEIGGDLDLAKMPGHWLLARMGKRVLRPGGRKLTSFLLDQLSIGAKHVIEFAPGVGATTELIVARNPTSYTGIERNETAASQVAALLPDEADYRCAVGSARDTGRDGDSADVVLGEAFLTMQTDDNKQKIVNEAFRILRPGGLYGVHELCLRPETLDPQAQERVRRDLSGVIRVGARPLTVREWRTVVERAGFVIRHEATVPMNLLRPRRLIDDEGLFRALRIVLKILRTPVARKRVRSMRAMFRRRRDHLGAIALVATTPDGKNS